MPMKVIVCFDSVRVTVPCGEGEILVRELISKAVHRYKRATGKGSSHWVEVTSLKTISGGGILDPDDQLSDVVDDREQLIAEFEEQDRPSAQLQHNGGDGASASSTGTVSPDIFQGAEGGALRDNSANVALGIFLPPRHNSSSSNNTASTDVVITPRDLSMGSNLRVRRGSEPNLTLLLEPSTMEKGQEQALPLRPLIPRRESESDEPRSESSDEEKRVKVTMHGSLDRKKLGQSRFSRDAFRTSLSNRPEMFRWLKAQERQEKRSKQAQAKERTGPVEGHDGKDINKIEQPNISTVVLQNDGGPLGIHAVPAYTEDGKDMGLLIQSIEPGRPVHRDGTIQPDDIIVQINEHSLLEVPFLRAQEIFRGAMDSTEIQLQVVKGSGSTVSPPSLPKTSSGKQTVAPQPPPVMPKPRSHIPVKPSPLTLPVRESEKPREHSSPVPAPRDHAKKATSGKSSNDSQQVENIGVFSSATVSNAVQKTDCSPPPLPASKRTTSSSSSSANNVIKPGPPIKPPKKVPPAIPARSPSTGLSSSNLNDVPQNAAYNTRKIGNKLEIKLKKGPLGLGFSVTSRDNQTDGNSPIYIRNILPKGAAVQDGQLRPGDRLLEVNGVKMTGKTQAEAVSFLRMLQEGSTVVLVVSRQDEVDEKFKVPRKLGDNSTPTSPQEGSFGDTDHVDIEDDQAVVSIPQPSHKGNGLEEESSAQLTEKITFHIQLNDTGSAGLGVSVKGKTEPFDSGHRDLGIFINSVLQGGAASKDGRLRVNDQLLEVNGIMLEGLPNTAAMEALRTAMMDESHIPGHSTIIIARRVDSALSCSSVDESLDGNQMDTALTQSWPDRPPLLHQRSSSASDASSPHSQRFGNDIMPSPIPPVRSKRVAALREKFTDNYNGLRNESYMKANSESLNEGHPGLRNESYTKATHNTFNDSGAFTFMPSPTRSVPSLKHSESQEAKENIVIIENDTYALPNKPQRPHSTIGFMHGGPRASHSSASDDDRRDSVSSNREESDLSPTGNLILPFAREGFGRQSMSEKRKGHLDPRSTEIYKLVKANKEMKGGFLGRRVRSFHVTGVTSVEPSYTGAGSSSRDTSDPWHKGENQLISQPPPIPNSMVHDPSNSTYHANRAVREPSTQKRSSSVEDVSNLTEVPAGISPQSSSNTSQHNRESSPMWRTNRFGRARACNDSFRAAVDRSYDALDPALMDTLEEESAESGAFTLDPSNSGRSSISSENTSEETNSLKRRKAKEKEKKGNNAGGGRLFKGFLRFGKGRKSNEDAIRRSRSEERSHERVIERRGDYSAERSLDMKDRWMMQSQPYGDVHNPGFGPMPSEGFQKQQRGRSASQQEQERIEEEYALLRDYHVSEQRLRSQSVDPTVGRNKIDSSSSIERSSPFQPYQNPLTQQQLLHQQQLLSDQHNVDPRLYHPAAVSQGPPFTGQEHRGLKPYLSSSGMDPEEKPNITKAVMSRAEYIQHLRSLYQQRHRQRHGVYPVDDSEEFYEKQIREMEERAWDPSSRDNSDHGHRDPDLVHFTDRPPSRQTDPQQVKRSYGSSSSMSNINSAQYQQQKHQQQQHYNAATAGYSGSRPQSRGAPTNQDAAALAYHQLQQNHRSQHPQYHNHHHQQQQHRLTEDFGVPSPEEQYNPNTSYPIYDARKQHQFYQGPSPAYASAPHPYSHHRGNHPHSDPSSAKV